MGVGGEGSGGGEVDSDGEEGEDGGLGGEELSVVIFREESPFPSRKEGFRGSILIANIWWRS